MPADTLDRELAGLDALESFAAPRSSRGRRLVRGLGPTVLAVGVVTCLWQVAVWSRWRPEYVLPSPFTVAQAFRDDLGDIRQAAVTTLRRGAMGFAFAVGIGGAVGVAATRFRAVRRAIGSLITGLQTMPSVAWTPLAIVLFKLSEGAIFFVVVLGAAPSIANGLLQGVDHVPPLLLRAGRVLGARGFGALRHVVLPAALPAFAGGLKQGWAFAWRSLMGAELLVQVAGRGSLGSYLENSRSVSDYPGMMAAMVTVLVIGVIIDIAGFGTLDRAIRRRYGLVDAAAS